MDCVNHSGVAATAYCQNCGKPLCTQCVRQGAGGQILCEQDFAAWQRVAQPFAQPPVGVPNPALAAVLGLIPGVGAMYNGQFFKGLIHVVIFAVLISIADHYGIFGIFIAAWVFYQSFEAYHTAKARREGTPVPDPLGLNEVSNWLNLSWHSRNPADEWARQQQAKTAAQAGGNPAAGPNPGFNPGGYQAPNPAPGAGTNAPYENVPYQNVPQPPGSGYGPAGAGPGTVGGAFGGVPPVPPVPPPPYWRRREPIGAVILIGLGLIFLLNQMGFVASRILYYSWPLLLIALGAWLLVRRIGDTKGGPQ